MRVFLTGASGFVGSHVLRGLLAAGHDVLALVVPDDPLWRVRDLVDRFSVVSGTLTDLPELRDGLSAWRPEACIHLAWYAEPGKYLRAPENIASLLGSLELVREMAGMGCTRIVGAGTCAEYDIPLGHPREDEGSQPATLYAAAKLSCGLLGESLAAQSDVRFAWARIFYPYGPYEDERRVVPALIRALLNGQPFPATHGAQVRDYIHVEDVAAAFVTLVRHQATGVFDVASGDPVTIRQLMQTIGDMLGKSDLIRFGALPCREWEPKALCGENGRLRRLGWMPRHTLREGLRQTVDWWRRRIEGADEDSTSPNEPAPRSLP